MSNRLFTTKDNQRNWVKWKSMALKLAHHRYAAIIDIRVNHLLKDRVSDNDVLTLIEQNIKMYRSIKTHATEEELECLCVAYLNFGIFEKLIDFVKHKAKSGACAPLVND